MASQAAAAPAVAAAVAEGADAGTGGQAARTTEAEAAGSASDEGQIHTRRRSSIRRPSIAQLQNVQSKVRGFLSRKAIREGTEALEMHLGVMSELALDDYEEWYELERRISLKDEQRAYLEELNGKRMNLTRQIEELTSDRYYLTVEGQRQAARDIRLLNEQLAVTMHEIALVKRGRTSVVETEAAGGADSEPFAGGSNSTPARPERKESIVGEDSPAAPTPASATNAATMQQSLLPFLRACNKHELREQSKWRATQAASSTYTVRLRLLLASDRRRAQLNGEIPWTSSSALEATAPADPVYVQLTVMTTMEKGLQLEREDAAKAREVAEKEAARRRTESASIAKLHPQGREAAVRKALLQTELWNPKQTESSRHCKSLRADLDHIGLQIRLAARAKSRTEKELALACGSKIQAGKARTDALRERCQLLDRYLSILEASRDVMLEEVKLARRSVMKSALRAKRQTIATAQNRDAAARLIQRVYRGYAVRLIHSEDIYAVIQAVREERLRKERIARSKRLSCKWGALGTVLRSAGRLKQKSVAAAMLQRAARERQWRQEALEQALEAMQKSGERPTMDSEHSSTLRFGAQRARLVERERVRGEQSPHAMRSARSVIPAQIKDGSPRTRLRHIMETQEERDARVAVVEAHVHRAAQSAQIWRTISPQASRPPSRPTSSRPSSRPTSSLNPSRPSGPRESRPSSRPSSSRPSTRPTSSLNPSRPSGPRESRPPSRPTSSRPTSRPTSSLNPSRPIGPRPAAHHDARRHHKHADQKPTSAARPMSARSAPSARPRSASRPQSASGDWSRDQALVPASNTELEAVTAFTLRRRAWVQTSTARSVLEEAAGEALRPCVDRMASQAVGSGAKAALLLARHACETPPSKLPEFENVERHVLFVNPRIAPDPKSTNARNALLWLDSSLPASAAKEQAAMRRKWRSEQHTWLRSSGLRRQVLLEEEGRANAILKIQQRDLTALHERMLHWQQEDDAALRLQAEWRLQLQKRRQRKMFEITLLMKGIVKEPDSPLVLAKESARKMSAFLTQRKLDLAAVDPPVEPPVDPPVDPEASVDPPLVPEPPVDPPVELPAETPVETPVEPPVVPEPPADPPVVPEPEVARASPVPPADDVSVDVDLPETPSWMVSDSPREPHAKLDGSRALADLVEDIVFGLDSVMRPFGALLSSQASQAKPLLA